MTAGLWGYRACESGAVTAGLWGTGCERESRVGQ